MPGSCTRGCSGLSPCRDCSSSAAASCGPSAVAADDGSGIVSIAEAEDGGGRAHPRHRAVAALREPPPAVDAGIRILVTAERGRPGVELAVVTDLAHEDASGCSRLRPEIDDDVEDHEFEMIKT